MGRSIQLGPADLVIGGAPFFGLFHDLEFSVKGGTIVTHVAVYPAVENISPAIANIVVSRRRDAEGDDNLTLSVPLMTNKLIRSDTYRSKSAVWHGRLKVPDDAEYIILFSVHGGSTSGATDLWRAIAIVEEP